MAQTFPASDGPRWRSLLGAGVLHIGLAYLLLAGLGVAPALSVPEAITVISLRPPPEPVSPEPAGEPAPAALEAKPVPRVAPPVVVPPEVPVIRAAPIPSLDTETSAGAAEVPGPGTGMGGDGDGMGAGGDGYGRGGAGTPPRFLSGIRRSDYPRAVREAGVDGRVEGIVGLSVSIDEDGRARDCRVTRSSGNPALDDVTCELVIKRNRYEPARDPSGRPVPSVDEGAQEWTPPDARDDDDR